MTGLRVIFPQANVCDLETFDAGGLQPGPGELLIKAQRSLISQGTEVTIFAGRHSNQVRSASWPAFPFAPGYSLAGTVLAVGPEVTNFAPGDTVFATAPHASHGLVSAASAVRVPVGVSAEQAAFSELGAIALNGVRLGQAALGEAVIVIGQGLVGLLTLRLARLAGARPLVAVDLSDERLQLSRDWGGADAAVDPRVTDPAAVLREYTDNRTADLVIEASGSPAAIAACLPWARTGGRVVLLGSPHGKVELSFYDHIHARNLNLIGGHIRASSHESTAADPWSKERHQKLFLDLLARGDMTVSELITHRVTPENVSDLYKTAAEKPGAVLGAIIDWEGSE